MFRTNITISNTHQYIKIYAYLAPIGNNSLNVQQVGVNMQIAARGIFSPKLKIKHSYEKRSKISYSKLIKLFLFLCI